MRGAQGRQRGTFQSIQRRQISGYGLRRLARRDADRAWGQYQKLSERIDWTVDEETTASVEADARGRVTSARYRGMHVRR